MRVKIKGQKWVGVGDAAIAIELSQADKNLIAAAPVHQSLFVFGTTDPNPEWAKEENPVPKSAPKAKAPAKKKGSTKKGAKK